MNLPVEYSALQATTRKAAHRSMRSPESYSCSSLQHSRLNHQTWSNNGSSKQITSHHQHWIVKPHGSFTVNDDSQKKQTYQTHIFQNLNKTNHKLFLETVSELQLLIKLFQLQPAVCPRGQVGGVLSPHLLHGGHRMSVTSKKKRFFFVFFFFFLLMA